MRSSGGTFPTTGVLPGHIHIKGQEIFMYISGDPKDQSNWKKIVFSDDVEKAMGGLVLEIQAAIDEVRNIRDKIETDILWFRKHEESKEEKKPGVSHVKKGR